jgi:hypothetical protein
MLSMDKYMLEISMFTFMAGGLALAYLRHAKTSLRKRILRDFMKNGEK